MGHDMKGMQMQQKPADSSAGASYNANMQSNPAVPKAGLPTELSVVVTEQKVGDPLKEFEKEHDVLMHMIVVSADLSFFDHIHPEFDANSGVFSLGYTFPEAGSYKIWTDATPKGGVQCLTAFRVSVEGTPRHTNVPLKTDGEPPLSKTFEQGKYRIDLRFSEQSFASHQDLMMTFTVNDSSGRGITDLHTWLGAKGHCVIISGDSRDFLHVHPMEDVDADWQGGPDVIFHTNFPKAGLYRIWPQFLHQGMVVTGNFTISVK